MYRHYEDPYSIEDMLADAKARLAEDPMNDDLAMEVAELKERANFAWQDEYQED